MPRKVQEVLEVPGEETIDRLQTFYWRAAKLDPGTIFHSIIQFVTNARIYGDLDCCPRAKSLYEQYVLQCSYFCLFRFFIKRAGHHVSSHVSPLALGKTDEPTFAR